MSKKFDYVNTMITGEETFEEINDMIQSMSDIDEIDYALYENNKIFGILKRMIAAHGRKLEKLTTQYEKVKLHRWRRYAGKWTAEQYKQEPMPEIPLKTDIDKYLAVDEMVVEMKSILNEQERIVKLIEDAQKSWSNRSYNIKTLVEWQKFQAGQ